MGLNHIVGNERVKRILSTYIQRKMIPTSMIFSGPDGTKMQPMAVAFAQTLNCLSPDKDPPERCPNCLAIEKRIFPDVRIIEPDGQFFKKAQIDELVDDAYLKPALAAKKVYILTDAHRMNDNAANAFLKTLEEPTPANVFILITSNLNLILPTIRSRCQILKFSPLSRDEIRGELVKKGFDAEKARLVSYYPDILLEQFSMREWQELEEKRAAAFSLLASLITQNDVEDVLLNLYDRSRNREQFLIYFRELVNMISVFLRDLLILQIDHQSQLLANHDYRAQLSSLLTGLSVDKCLFLIRNMEFLLRDVQRNLNARVLILEFINSFSPE